MAKSRQKKNSSSRWTVITIVITISTVVLFLILYEKRYQIGYFLSDLFWRIWLSFMGIDQKIIWGIFIIILCFVFIIRNLLNPESATVYNSPDSGRMYENRLQTWVSSIKPVLAEKNNYYSKWALARDFHRLLITTLSVRLALDPAKARDMVKRGDFEAPREIHDYLQTGGNPLTEIKIESVFTRFFRSTPLDLNPEQMMQFLEAQYDNEN